MSKIKLIFSTFVLFFSMTASSMPETFKQIKMDRALMFLSQEKYEEALKEIIPLYKEDPSEDHLQILASATFELGLYERAKNFFTLILERNPESSDAAYYLGVTLYYLRDMKGAQKLLEELQQDSHFQYEAKFYLGMISQERGDNLKAVEYFSKAAEDPTIRAKAKYRAAVAVHGEAGKTPGLLPIAKELFNEAIKNSNEEEGALKESAQGYISSIERIEKDINNNQKTFIKAKIGSVYNALPGYPGYPLLPLETVIPFLKTWDLNAELNIDYLIRPNFLINYTLDNQTELDFENLDWQRHVIGIVYNEKESTYGFQGQVAFADLKNFSFLSQRTSVWGEWSVGEVDKSNTILMVPLSFFLINEKKLIGNQPLGSGLLIHPRLTLEFDADGHKLATVFLAQGYLSSANNIFGDGGGMLTYQSPGFGIMKIAGEAGSRFRYFPSSTKGKELDVWGKVGLNLNVVKWLGINIGTEWKRRYADLDSEKFDNLSFMLNLFANTISKTKNNYVQPSSPK